MEPEVVKDLEQEPISLSQARAWLKVNEALTSEDELITLCIQSARQQCEKYTGLAFGPKTLRLKTATYNGLKSLPYGPNQKAIHALDSEGNEVPVDKIFGLSLEYLRGFTVQNTYVDEFGWDGVPKGIFALGTYAEGIPGLYNQEYTVTYETGFAAGKLPANIKMAILKLTAELYENRENSVVGTIVAELPTGVKQLLDLERANVVFQ